MPPETPTIAPIAFAKRGHNGSWKVFVRGTRILSYKSEANAKHLARYINDVNEQIERNPEDREKILAHAQPGPFPEPNDTSTEN